MNTGRWRPGAAAVLALGVGMAADFPASAQQLPPGQVRLFTAIDADKDGAVSKAEYAAYRDVQFKRHDPNKDSVIGREEFLGMSRGGGGAEARFKTLDKDGDGKVTKSEWDSDTESLFAGRDANKDGKLTPDEMAPMHMMRRMP